MPAETNAARAAEIWRQATRMSSGFAVRENAIAAITAALDGAEARGLERGATWHDAEMKRFNEYASSDRSKDAADHWRAVAHAHRISAEHFRALLIPSPAAQPEGER